MSQDSQPVLSQATPAPRCPKHPEFTSTHAGHDKSCFRRGGGEQFLCSERDCLVKMVSKTPTCPECRNSMHINQAAGNLYYWVCYVSHRPLAQKINFCDDCGGTGWLHMDNRSAVMRDQKEPIIGVDGGMFVDACSTCDRFPTMTAAELVHRNECQCGHGLPQPGERYKWVGYPGSNREISTALTAAGFVVYNTSNEEVVCTWIQSTRTRQFINALDEVHQKMEESALRCNGKTYTGLVIGGSSKKEEYTMTAVEQNPEKNEQQYVKSLRKYAAPSLSNTQLQRPSTRELKDAIYGLLGQLNDMNFRDHSIDAQRRLESRRRAVMEKMSAIDTGIFMQGTTSLVNDRLATNRRGILPKSGGYEFQNLKKEELEDEAVLHGSIFLDSHNYRVVLIEVHDIDGEQRAVKDPNDWYHDVGEMMHGQFQTIKVDGHPGNYVLCIFPGSK